MVVAFVYVHMGRRNKGVAVDALISFLKASASFKPSTWWPVTVVTEV
jgi:hypothetical protein